MPRFYFHIFDGVTVLDTEGSELANWREAMAQAVRLAGEVLTWSAGRIGPGEDWRMEVVDEAGLILLRLDFSVVAGAAIVGSSPRHEIDEQRKLQDGGP